MSLPPPVVAEAASSTPRLHRVRRESHRSRRCSRRGCANGVGPARSRQTSHRRRRGDRCRADRSGDRRTGFGLASSGGARIRFEKAVLLDDRWRVPARISSSCGWPKKMTSTPTGCGCRSASRVPGMLLRRRRTGGRARRWPPPGDSRVASAGSRAGARALKGLLQRRSRRRHGCFGRGRSRRRWRLSCSKAGPLSSRRRPSSMTIVWLSTRGCIATMPVMTRPCGSCRQHGVIRRHRCVGILGR